MTTEYKLSYTGAEINEKLGEIDKLVDDAAEYLKYTEQELTEEQKEQVWKNLSVIEDANRYDTVITAPYMTTNNWVEMLIAPSTAFGSVTQITDDAPTVISDAYATCYALGFAVSQLYGSLSIYASIDYVINNNIEKAFNDLMKLYNGGYITMPFRIHYGQSSSGILPNSYININRDVGGSNFYYIYIKCGDRVLSLYRYDSVSDVPSYYANKTVCDRYRVGQQDSLVLLPQVLYKEADEGQVLTVQSGKVSPKALPQSDWNITDENDAGFIKNKPEILQSDWEQNDENAADYIKNRTHWVETEDTLLEGTFENYQSIGSPNTLSFKIGDTIYRDVAATSDGITSTFCPGEYTVSFDSFWYTVTVSPETTFEFVVTNETVHQIPTKYMPNNNIVNGTTDGSIRSSNSYVEDESTYKIGHGAIALGNNASASGYGAIALGTKATASGDYAIALGDTNATGTYSHAEGRNNASNKAFQFMQGNGTNATPSNAHTRDHYGNGWYASAVYVGGTPVGDDTNPRITSGIVRDATVDYSSCQKLATENYVDDAVANIDIPDTSKFITVIPDEYVTESELNAKGYLTEHQSLDGYAKMSDIAKTVLSGFSNSDTIYVKVSDFGAWGGASYYHKSFSMLLTSRAGELIWLSLSANDNSTTARAFRLIDTYSKINAVYYSESESAIYCKMNAWCNNLCAHILSNVEGDYVPTVAQATALPDDATEINIVEFGVTNNGTQVGDTSVKLLLGGSATRPTYNGNDMALQSDIPSTTETWTFTLEDGSTVTKAVYVG